jgi:hypothetical protein
MLNKPRPSGTEMMLRSMGLGDVIEAAQRFASAGTVDKITGFADKLDIYIARAERNERLLTAIARQLGIDADTITGILEAGGLEADQHGGSGANGSVEPGGTAVTRGDADGSHGVSDGTG